jgi:LemA protein
MITHFSQKWILILLGMAVAATPAFAQSPRPRDTNSGVTTITSSEAKMDKSWTALCNLYQRRAALVKTNSEMFASSFDGHVAADINAGIKAVESAQLSAARAPTDPNVLAAFARAQAPLSRALTNLLVASQSIPSLRTSKAFQTFMAQLTEIETTISSSRTAFNDAVRNYNSAVQTAFPLHPLFSDAPSEKAPEINFNFASPTPHN